MPIVEIPEVGNVEFPDSMSPDEIASTIKEKILPSLGPSEKPQPEKKGFFQRIGEGLSQAMQAEAEANKITAETVARQAETPLVNVPPVAFALGLPGAIAPKTTAAVSKSLSEIASGMTSPVGLATTAAAVVAPEIVGPAVAIASAKPTAEAAGRMSVDVNQGDIPAAAGEAVKVAAGGVAMLGSAAPLIPKASEGVVVDPTVKPALEGEVPPIRTMVSPGPGAQSTTQPKYPPIEQLSDRLAKLQTGSPAEHAKFAENLAAAWAEGKDAVTTSMAKMQAVGQAVKDAAIGLREITDLERRVGELDAQLQTSRGLSLENKKAQIASMPNKTEREAAAILAENPDPQDIQAVLSTPPKVGQKPMPKNVRDALELALNPTKEVNDYTAEIQDFFRRRENDAVSQGIFEQGLEDYFTHIWKDPDNLPSGVRGAFGSGQVSTYFKFAANRKIGSLIEGIREGKVPELDPAEIVPYYNYAMDKAIAGRQFIKSLEDMNGSDGRPLLAPTGITSIARDASGAPESTFIKPRAMPEEIEGYRRIDHPSLRKWNWSTKDENGKPVFYQGDLAVHPEAYERLSRMLDRSRLNAGPTMRAALQVGGIAKGLKLGLLSFFHDVHVSSHAVWHWTNPIKAARTPIDWNDSFTQFALEKGHLSLAPSERELSIVSEGIGPGVAKKIPFIGPISELHSQWLFTQLIPRLKMATFRNAWERNLNIHAGDIAKGKLTEEQLAARVGDSVNNAFGELNRLWLGKDGRSPEVQRALQLGLLAPDFGEARLRFLTKAFTRYGTEERLALATMGLTLYGLARVGNWLSHGDPELDTKHAFSVKVGDHWVSMRSVIGDVWHLMTDAGHFMANRLSPLFGRTLLEAFSGRASNGVRRTGIQQIEDVGYQFIPIHLGALTRDDQKLWESLMGTMGLQVWRAPASTEIHRLASDWKKANGIEDRNEILEAPSGNPYRKMRLALEFDQPKDFQKAFDEQVKLLAKRKTPNPETQVRKSLDRFYNAPFVGAKKLEGDFKRSLSESELKLYAEAQAERHQLQQKMHTWLAERKPAPESKPEGRNKFSITK